MIKTIISVLYTLIYSYTLAYFSLTSKHSKLKVNILKELVYTILKNTSFNFLKLIK